MKYLFIETFPISPHLETSLEIALDLKKSGHDVYFFWNGYDLPWTDWDLPFYKKLLLFSYKKKMSNVCNFLKKNSINVIEKFTLDEDIFNLIEKETNKIKKIKNLKFYKYKKKYPIGMSAYSSLVSRYHKDDIELLKNKVFGAYKSGCIVFERANKVIKEIKPNIIFTFNNRFVISKPITEAAKLNNVKVYTHERGSTLSKYEIFEGDIFDNKITYNTINKYWKKETDNSKKLSIANKYFSQIEKKTYFKKIGFNYDNFNINKISVEKNKKVILYLCTTDYEHQAISADVNRFYLNKEWSKQINTIKSIIKIIKKDKHIILYIKAHPNFGKSKDLESSLKKMTSKNIVYLPSSSKVDSINLIKNSDLVFTFGSSLELYAVFCGKKVFSFFKSRWSKFNIVKYPKNNLDLKNLIYSTKKIENMKTRKKNLLKITYYIMIYGIKFKFFKPLGHSKGIFIDKEINHYGVIYNLLIKIDLIFKMLNRIIKF